MYLVEQEHTSEQCMKALDQFEQSSPEMLDRCYFGCGSGDHTAFCFVESTAKSEAEKFCSSDFGGDCRVIPVEQYSAEKIRSFHGGSQETTYGQESHTMGTGESGYGKESGSEYGTEKKTEFGIEGRE